MRMGEGDLAHRTGARTKTWGFAAVIAGLMAFSALAQPNPRQEVFRELDTNGDGCIDRVEFEANKVRVIFRNAQGDQARLRFEDTKLSRSAFDQIDADRNGFITPADIIHSPIFYFDQFDANNDGCIDAREFNAMFAKLEANPAK